jgi:hypothetical protein
MPMTRFLTLINYNQPNPNPGYGKDQISPERWEAMIRFIERRILLGEQLDYSW